MAKRTQPAWAPLPRPEEPVLKLYNSLTRQKEVFVPKSGNKVTWYSCGPTVYDATHMGHARSYITFDILRRVLSDYFGYDIMYVMNITDIDDKIIKRARQNHLFDKYLAEKHSLESILADAKEVTDKLETTCKDTVDVDKRQMLEKLLDKLVKSIEELAVTVKGGDSSKIKTAQNTFLTECKDPFADWLDGKLGSTVKDNAIFSVLPAYWEQEYHKDMESLNVLKPHVLTRVSEYVPEIVKFIEKIIENGFAYESNGSVYFDVGAFDKCDKHHYAKLVPEAYGDTNSLQEGEGDLSVTTDKHSPTDFALWKASRPGEPSYPSPWGTGGGRPGWHIECSAMAAAICGSSLDIHTGGVDLKFPHHDNEIAQTEAYYGCGEWVRYFLHAGHLTIAGCKMSKSLKNFVSVREALERYTARQLRFGFLLHGWKETLDYSDNTMEIALQTEKLFNEFFLNIKDAIRSSSTTSCSTSTFTKWSTTELTLNDRFQTARQRTHAALCDNVDTRGTLDALRELVTASNVYLRDCKQEALNGLLLRNVAGYVTRILRVFGTVGEGEESIGFPIGGEGAGTGNTEDTIMPYLTILAQFRDNIRTAAKSLPAATNSTLLTECDRLRDDVLPQVGVRLEDREGAASAVKLADRDTLLRERDAKRAAEVEKAAEKERKRAAVEAAKKEKEEKMKVRPEDMFRGETGKYSKFDESGLPTHDAEGKEISKGQLKKLQKLQQTQKKLHDEYKATFDRITV